MRVQKDYNNSRKHTLHAANTIFNTQGSTFIPGSLHDQEGFALSPSLPLKGETPGEFHGRNEIAVSLVHYLL